MADKTDMTVKDCLQGAFQALLRGDTHQRDVLCAMAEKAFKPGETSCPGDRSVLKLTITDAEFVEIPRGQ